MLPNPQYMALTALTFLPHPVLTFSYLTFNLLPSPSLPFSRHPVHIIRYSTYSL